jgi:hypothetical protein
MFVQAPLAGSAIQALEALVELGGAKIKTANVKASPNV